MCIWKRLYAYGVHVPEQRGTHTRPTCVRKKEVYAVDSNLDFLLLANVEALWPLQFFFCNRV